MEVKKYIAENEERFLEELFSLIRIPSISAKPEHKDDMMACAQRWVQLLLAAGADEAHVMPTMTVERPAQALRAILHADELDLGSAQIDGGRNDIEAGDRAGNGTVGKREAIDEHVVA